MKLCCLAWALFFVPVQVRCSYPSFPPTPYPNPAFVPAMPGKTPKCVKDPRLTFCLDPEKYPKERILYLLENKMYDVDTLLQDETRDTYTFEAREAAIIPTMSYGKTTSLSRGYANSKVTSHYLPPNNNTQYGRRPAKFGTPRYLKPPPSVPPHPTNYYYSSNTTPTLNSFTSYPSKYDSSQNSHSSRSTPHYGEEGPYPRYPKNKFRTTVAPYQPPGPQHTWWKKILRRERRQTNLSDLCPAEANYIMPRAAQSVVGDWMFLVNVDQRYRQLVKSETCIQNSCQGACDVPDGFSAICQQQYVQKRLVALDGSGSKLNSDMFWFPSCCICKVRVNAG